MVTKRDDNRQPTTDNRRQGEYRAICLWKMDWQSFAIILVGCSMCTVQYVMCDVKVELHIKVTIGRDGQLGGQ